MGSKLYPVAPEHLRPLSAFEEWNHGQTSTGMHEKPEITRVTLSHQNIIPPHGEVQYHNLIPNNPEPMQNPSHPEVPVSQSPVRPHIAMRIPSNRMGNQSQTAKHLPNMLNNLQIPLKFQFPKVMMTCLLKLIMHSMLTKTNAGHWRSLYVHSITPCGEKQKDHRKWPFWFQLPKDNAAKSASKIFQLKTVNASSRPK